MTLDEANMQLFFFLSLLFQNRALEPDGGSCVFMRASCRLMASRVFNSAMKHEQRNAAARRPDARDYDYLRDEVGRRLHI